jgi:hypothetical protein
MNCNGTDLCKDEVEMKPIPLWKGLLPLLLLLTLTACDLRTYPNSSVDDDDNDTPIWTADSVAITYYPTSTIGLDSLAVEINAFAFRNGVARSGLRVYWGVMQLDEAAGYFLDSEVVSATTPPGKATAVFISGSSPSGTVRLFVEPVVGFGGDSVDVVLHKRPQMTFPPDTSMSVSTLDIILPVYLHDDRQHPLTYQTLHFDAYPDPGVVTAFAYTDYNGRAQISFDAQGTADTFMILGWLPQFPTQVRDTLYIEVWETGL